MANVSLAWMVDRVREFTKLKFNDDTLNIIVARYMDNSKSNTAESTCFKSGSLVNGGCAKLCSASGYKKAWP